MTGTASTTSTAATATSSAETGSTSAEADSAAAEHIDDAMDGMVFGTVALSVPLRDGLIQVGTADTLPSATIEVCTGPAAVSVQRIDGQPLQAQIVHRRPDGTEELRTVFTEPVARLRLRRTRHINGPRLWVVTEGAEARSAADLVQLIRTIVRFAAAKQRRDDSGPTARPA
ncbi:MAG: hypothetical protein KDB56_05695 [Mycobacterium sp.]|nr:hypothetical protein [Mycobacterium sp.]